MMLQHATILQEDDIWFAYITAGLNLRELQGLRRWYEGKEGWWKLEEGYQSLYQA